MVFPFLIAVARARPNILCHASLGASKPADDDDDNNDKDDDNPRTA